MQTIQADGSGNIYQEFPTQPGKEYSLYAIPHAAGDGILEPAAGELRFFHKDDTDCPILDTAGDAVVWDISATDGAAFNFVAQTRAILVIGNGMVEDDGIRFSLVPTIR